MALPFHQLSQQKQIAQLMPIADRAAREIGIQPTKITLLHYAYNATFKVESNQPPVALKLITDSPRSLSNLKAELRWCQQLVDQQIPCVAPLTQTVTRHDLPGFPKPIHAIAFNWLPGRQHTKRSSPRQLRRTAQIIKNLHANPYQSKPDAAFPEFRDCLGGQERRISHPEVIDALDEAQTALEKLWQRQPAISLHFDLHNGNIRVQKGRLIPFDFEFAHVAPPLVELAALTFLHTYLDNPYEAQTILENTTGLTAADAGLTEREFQALILSRSILLANDLYFSTHPDLVNYCQTYAEKTAHKCRHFLTHGTYHPKP
jgi:Ser/Thr protein kinase RdoA (MazF antagonist)